MQPLKTMVIMDRVHIISSVTVAPHSDYMLMVVLVEPEETMEDPLVLEVLQDCKLLVVLQQILVHLVHIILMVLHLMFSCIILETMEQMVVLHQVVLVVLPVTLVEQAAMVLEHYSQEQIKSMRHLALHLIVTTRIMSQALGH